MPHTPNLNNFRTSSGTSLANLNLGWITKEYLMSVYPQIANQIITPELWVWGVNSSAQLGNNTTPGSSTPVTTFAGGTNWKQVSSGWYHHMAIKTDGTLWGWGAESAIYDSSQLGTNPSSTYSLSISTPVTTFAGGTDWKSIECGGTNSAAIKTDGTLWIWGNNYGGQLGIDTFSQQTIKTPITTFAGGTNWKQVSLGIDDFTSFFTAAIKTDGTLWVWGMNYNYSNNLQPLGINEDGFSARRYTPVTTFAGGTNWKQVSCGYVQMAAIKTDGTLWVWGSNPYGELGTNNTTGSLTPVTTFAGGTNWKQVACGVRYTAAIKTDGTLWVWGINAAVTPVTTFAGGTTWKQLSKSTTAIKTDGTLWIWGSSGSTTTPLFPGTNWKQVSSSDSYFTAAAIRSADSI